MSPARRTNGPACLLAAWLALLPAGAAAPARAEEALFPDLTPEQEDTALFVLGGTLLATYFLAANAVIDRLGLPLHGDRGDAAASLVTVWLATDNPDALRAELAASAIDAWTEALNAIDAGRPVAVFWRSPGLDAFRRDRAVCRLAGSDPEGFRDYARGQGLTADQLNACALEFRRARSRWLELLGPWLRAPDETAGDARIAIRFQPRPGDEDIVEFLQATGVIADAMDELADSLRLPAGLRLTFRGCGDAGAYWNRPGDEMVVCYELVRSLETTILEARGARPPP